MKDQFGVRHTHNIPSRNGTNLISLEHDLSSLTLPQYNLSRKSPQFQAKQANEIQTWELVRTINRALVDSMLLEDRLRNIFDRWWSDLDATLKNLPESQTNQEIERPLPDMIKEILGLVRNLSRPTREADTFTISLVNYLSPKEERMIRMLFGLGEERRYSFEEIGQVFGISSKSVDNQIRAAFAKLRSMDASLYEREQQKP